MRIITIISSLFLNYRKKRIIRNELKAKFKQAGIDNKKRRNELTDAIYTASKIVHKEISKVECKKNEFKDKNIYTDIKCLIDRYQLDEIQKLKKNNQHLENILVNKDESIDRLKKKVIKLVQ